MRTIWKFPVEASMTLALPADATVLTVQLQHGVPQMWMVLDPEHPMTPRTFRVLGTGHPVPEGPLTYCGTFQREHGALVFHVFETTPREHEDLRPAEARAMTREGCIAALDALTRDDIEAAHIDADALLVTFLDAVGEADVAAAWRAAKERLGFWYA